MVKIQVYCILVQIVLRVIILTIYIVEIILRTLTLGLLQG